MLQESAPPANPVRLLLVDDHALFRAGLRLILAQQAGLEVVGEAATQAEALAVATQTQPKIILLDLNLGPVNSLDFLPDLKRVAPQAQIIVLTGVQEVDQHKRAIRLGAVGLVLKEKAAEVLLRAIDRIQAGEIWFDRSLISQILIGDREPAPAEPTPAGPQATALTPREREIIQLIGEGLKNKEIGERLFISEITVRNRLTVIYEKLGVTNRQELMIYAYRYGLAVPPVK